MIVQQRWELPAGHPAEYHAVEARRGREFILRLTTGADVFLSIPSLILVMAIGAGMAWGAGIIRW